MKKLLKLFVTCLFLFALNLTFTNCTAEDIDSEEVQVEGKSGKYRPASGYN